MKKFAFIFLVAFVVLGCIKNDIPYPRIKAEITAFEVEGQVSCAIDNNERTVSIELNESVDISMLTLKRFEVSNDALVTPEISSPIDLSTPKTYTLTTYQDYVWTVSAVQNVERYFRVKNQIGESLFDLDSRIVLVTVASNQDLSKMEVLEAKLGAEGSEIIPNPKTVTNFSNTCKFSVVYKDRAEVWSVMVIKSSVSIVTGQSNAFAKYAILSGQFQSGSGEPTFEYKKSSESSWTTFPTSQVSVSAGEFIAKISPLEPGTEYSYRAVMGDIKGTELSFTTEEALQVENSSFDDWCKDGKSWFPAKSLSEADYWWDSGNIGTNTLGEKNPTFPEEEIVVKGKAAKLASTAVVGVFAAGSIYTGQYIKTVGVGAQLSFGRPFKSRPVGLKGYMNYLPGIIDKAKDPYTQLKGKSDTCHIYAILTDWATPFQVNTTTKTFVDLDNDPGIIAKCELKRGTSTNGYEEFNINFNYKSAQRIPNYIVIVAAASKYGDYFTGSTSTVLYVDELELTY